MFHRMLAAAVAVAVGAVCCTALAKDKEDGIKDIKAGRVDPRVVAVLTKLSGEHKVTVTGISSNQDELATGGANHHLGRGMDIGADDFSVDGADVLAPQTVLQHVVSETAALTAFADADDGFHECQVCLGGTDPFADRARTPRIGAEQ